MNKVSSELFWRSAHTHPISSISDQWDSQTLAPLQWMEGISENGIHKSQLASFSPNLTTGRCQIEGCVLSLAPPGSFMSKSRLKGSPSLCLVFSAANPFMEIDTNTIFAGSSSEEALITFIPVVMILTWDVGDSGFFSPLHMRRRDLNRDLPTLRWES